MTHKYLDVNDKLRKEIENYVKSYTEIVARDIARTAVENICKEYINERLTARVGEEVEKFEMERLEEAAAYTLKKYGIVPRLNSMTNFESVQTFLNCYPSLFDKNKNMTTDEVYSLYCEMCEESDEMPIHKKSFSRELNRLTGIKTTVKSINGKSTRIYVKY